LQKYKKRWMIVDFSIDLIAETHAAEEGGFSIEYTKIEFFVV